MRSRHTPGPWAPERKTPDGFYLAIRVGLTGPRICEVRPENQEADARLIAAAPDLLEALEWLMDEFDRRELGGAAVFCGSDMAQVRLVVKKARGEAWAI